MRTITITLNGVEVSGYEGMTILELAKEIGIEIPTLCYDSHLTSVGACRICLVENEKTKALVASCVTPISSGMVINTNSPRVIEARKTIVELMLSNHPDSCMVCDEGNHCQLRKIASDLGVRLVEFERLRTPLPIKELNPFIQRDLSKCILCGKCVRVCQEFEIIGAIDYSFRGYDSKPSTLHEKPLEESECTFCGTCVSMCPVGALSEKGRKYRGSPEKSVDTTCSFCGCGCGFYLETKDDEIIGIETKDNNSFNGIS